MNREQESHQHYYNELVRKARQADITAWLHQHRPDIITRKVGQEFTIIGMDSIRIRGHMWYRHSRKGENPQGNAIDFLVEICGMSQKQAIISLTGVNLTGSGKFANLKPTEHNKKIETQAGVFSNSDVTEFDINALDLHKNQRRVIAYLTQNRGISPAVVLEEIKNKNLFQEVQRRIDEATGEIKEIHNAIFAMRDENGEIIGAEAIGTLSYENARFKSVKAGSKTGYGYNTGQRHDPQYILFFESAVDLLSFIHIKRIQAKTLENCLLVSMAGLKSGTVANMLAIFGKSAQPVFCVDNDEAGQNFIASACAEFPTALVHQPDKEYKDWNDQIIDKKIES
jgi:hypothetical protein